VKWQARRPGRPIGAIYSTHMIVGDVAANLALGPDRPVFIPRLVPVDFIGAHWFCYADEPPVARRNAERRWRAAHPEGV
jgi:hypothetical protein